MDLSDFEALIRRLIAEFPQEFLAGVVEVTVSPRAVPHPERPDIFTLGQCIPLPSTSDEPEAINSRVVLYHGSFAAVAQDHPDFDWEAEAWETLTHEIRHHVEWRARSSGLEALDDAAEENYARQEGEPFDPLFYRDGEPVGDRLFRVEDDYFIEVAEDQVEGRTIRFEWGGRRYRSELPAGLEPPAYLSVEGLPDSEPGEVLLVIRPKARGRWFRSLRGQVARAEVTAVPEP